MEFRIRHATIADADTIVEFNQRLAAETEGKQLDEVTLRRGVSRAFDRGDEVLYFVAETDAQVIGQVMLTREWSDWRDGWMYWLQSVYVHAEHRRFGVFRGLLDHAKQVLLQRGDVVGLRLYVEVENHAAMGTYRRLGFADPGYRVMEWRSN